MLAGLLDSLQAIGQAIQDDLATWSVWQWVVASRGVAALLADLTLAWRKRALVRQYFAPLFVVGRRLAHVLGIVARFPGRLVWAAVAAGLGAVSHVRAAMRDRDEQVATPAASDEVESDATESASEVGVDAPSPEAPAPLDRARQHLELGATDTAVLTAYAVAREHISTAVDPSPQATHWEFYNTVRDQLAAEQGDALQRLTETYEAAAFAPTAVGTDAAQAALDLAEQFEGESVVRSNGGEQSPENGAGGTSGRIE